MIRVYVMVEGQTEETFVRDLLYDHFQGRGVFLNPILLRTSAQGKGGPLIAMDIGLASMRQRCPHFHAWLKQLEALAP